MKKFIAIMCMAVLLVSSALAAGSPSGNISDDFKATADGYTIVVEEADFELPKAADFGAEGYDAYALNVYAKDADGNVVALDKPVDVTFESFKIENGASVIAIHAPEEGAAFQKETVKSVETNKAVVTFSSLSPVVLYIKNVNEENQQGGESDKTGEPAVMTVVALIAMTALLGMAVTAKKEN